MVRCYVKAGLTDRPGLGLIRGSRTEGFLYPRHCEEQSDEAHQSFCKDKAPHCGQVAQLVEQRTENPRVGGSIPPLATIIHKAFSFLVISIFSFGEHNITASPPQYFTEEVFVPCARPCCAWGGAGRPT